MMTNKQIIEVVTAAENGAEIERRRLDGMGLWELMREGDYWNFGAYEFRIKPQPPKKIKLYGWWRTDTEEVRVSRFDCFERPCGWVRLPHLDCEVEES